MENLPKKGPLFREFGTQKPTHMGGTYPYPQHVMYPPPPGLNGRDCWEFLQKKCCHVTYLGLGGGGWTVMTVNVMVQSSIKTVFIYSLSTASLKN